MTCLKTEAERFEKTLGSFPKSHCSRTWLVDPSMAPATTRNLIQNCLNSFFQLATCEPRQ